MNHTAIKHILVIGLIATTLGSTDRAADKTSQGQSKQQDMKVTQATLKQILEAFNRHDLDAIMEFFSDECSFDAPRGPDYVGRRFVGKAQVREALGGRFKGIPDVHYGEDQHWISSDGNMGVSEWTLSGTTTSGAKVRVRGCDLWEFKNGKVIRKNSFWKIVEPEGR